MLSQGSASISLFREAFVGIHFRRDGLVIIAAGLFWSGCGDNQPFGPDAQFRATAGSGLTAAAAAWDRIQLSWQDNATNETGWEVHRSTAGPAGAFALHSQESANVTAFSDGALQGSAQYCYKVRSARTQGRRITFGAFSNTACATTPAAPPHPAPTGVRAFPNDGSAIVVVWVDNSTYESGFRIERGGAATGPWTAVATVQANLTGYFDTTFGGVEVQRCYRVVAMGQGSETPSSSDCTMMPAAPSNLLAALNGGGVNLEWTDNSAVEDGYSVTRHTAWSNGYVEIARLGPNSRSYRDTSSLQEGWAFYFVQATRDSGTSARSNQGYVAVEPPPQPPFTYSPTPASSSVVSVSWQATSENAAGFTVERSLDDGLTWSPIATVPNESWHVFNDSGLVSERRVCYQITAFNSGGTASAVAGCTTPPAAPSAVTLTLVDPSSSLWEFTWTDKSAVEDGFEIGYQTCDGITGYCWVVTIATVGPNVTRSPAQDLDPSNYRYLVFARKDGGSSDLVFANP